MREFEDNCVDTIITDVPYGLFFMGKKWDYEVPSIEIFQEMLRVIKPGGTMLCFAGSRTQHRMACNIEDAGWILKDCIMWLYGSGFPKATDISKQLDKKANVKRKQGKDYVAPDGGKRDLSKHKPHKEARVADHEYGYTTSGFIPSTLPSTPEAKLWNGWKSHGLKPAYEPIILAMKPNEGTYAENALKHGVSGLNIDGGRIPLNGENPPTGSAKRVYKNNQYTEKKIYGDNKQTPLKGRYPANIILDEVAAEMLDKQTGVLQSGDCPNGFKGEYKANIYGKYQNNQINPDTVYADRGGASRFFYCAKASKAERNAGLEGIEEKNVSHDGRDKYIENPYQRHDNIQSNNHPTVKPLKLMEYLCILTRTPTGGIVLDPFMGSGTTGMACVNTERKFIGIEQDIEYCEIAVRRIIYASDKANTCHKSNRQTQLF